MLCYFLFCSRSPVSVGQFRVCSRLFVKAANALASSVKYHFSDIFATNVFNSNKVFEYLFAKQRKRTFKLDVLYSSEKDYKLIDSKQNCRMNFFVARDSADLVVALSEVYVGILTNIF